MKLEIGMYVRTKNGKIDKIIGFDRALILFLYDLVYGYIDENDIIKASHKIIDILEVGDYVNGYYVEDVLKTFVNVAVGSNYFQSPTIYEKDIKSIVTKEMFESMKYEVK